jgi:cell wall-associated NlpC family hydrolase
MNIDVELEQRAKVEAIARSWIGTPYHSNARVKGAGIDCAHLLIAVYAEAGLIKDFDPGYYSPQFFLHSKEERFLSVVLTYAHEIEEASARPGDLVLYKFGLCYAHGGIIVSPGWPDAIVHARYQSRTVLLESGVEAGLSRSERNPRFFSVW